MRFSLVYTVKVEDFVRFIVNFRIPVSDSSIAVGRGEEFTTAHPRHTGQNLERGGREGEREGWREGEREGEGMREREGGREREGEGEGGREREREGEAGREGAGATR